MVTYDLCFDVAEQKCALIRTNFTKVERCCRDRDGVLGANVLFTGCGSRQRRCKVLAVNFNQLQGSSGEENECEENIFDLVLT